MMSQKAFEELKQSVARAKIAVEKWQYSMEKYLKSLSPDELKELTKRDYSNKAWLKHLETTTNKI